MANNIEGKVVVITGASSGIGESTAPTLRSHGLCGGPFGDRIPQAFAKEEDTMAVVRTRSQRRARRIAMGLVAFLAITVAMMEGPMTRVEAAGAVKNVVLVHGGFVDGSGWKGVYDILRREGFTITIVQNPTTSLADDVAVTKRALAAQSGPAILVGHSYGGVVITEAGNDRNVAGLVYIAAFAPDAGESVSSLIKDPPAGAPVPPILPPQDGYLFLDRSRFRASFAADVETDTAAFMADSQVAWGVAALEGAVTAPAWKSKPSWYLVATNDKMIPPDAQRAMSKRAGSTAVEVDGSHAVYASQPRSVALLIEQAAKSLTTLAAR